MMEMDYNNIVHPFMLIVWVIKIKYAHGYVIEMSRQQLNLVVLIF